MSNRFARTGEDIAQYKERRKSEVISAYERRVVKKILVGLGVDRASLALGKKEVDQTEQEAFMTMAWFAGEYPTFPVILMTRETWTPNVVDFFKVRSRNNSFWAVWEDVTECLKGNNKPMGCVFPFPQVTDMGHGIIHNLSLPYQGYDSTKDLIFMSRITVGDMAIVLETLDSFVNRLRTVWEPL